MKDFTDSKYRLARPFSTMIFLNVHGVVASGTLSSRRFRCQMNEPPHGVTIVDCIFQSFIRNNLSNLEQIHPKQGFNSSSLPAALIVVIVRLNHRNDFDLVHAFEKLFSLSFPLAIAILDICEICLSLHVIHPQIHFIILPGARHLFNQCLPRHTNGRFLTKT